MTPRAPASAADERRRSRSALLAVAVAVGLVAVVAAGIGGAVDPGSFAFAAGSDDPGDRTHHEATARLAEPSEHDDDWLDQLTLDYGDADVDLDGVAAEDVTVTVDGEDVEADHGNELAVSANDGTLVVDVRGAASIGDDDYLLQTALESGDQIEVTVADVENPAAGEYAVEFGLRSADSQTSASSGETKRTSASTTWTVGEPAAFAVADLSVENAVSGGEATLEATVKNEGDLDGTAEVTFVVDDGGDETVLATESVVLDGAEETRVTATARLPEGLADETAFAVRSSDDEAVEIVDVETEGEGDAVGANETGADEGGIAWEEITDSDVVTGEEALDRPVFVGQTLVVEAFEPGESVEIREGEPGGSAVVDVVSADENGTVTFDTMGYDGEFFLRGDRTGHAPVDEDGDRQTVVVTEQTMTLAFESEIVSTEGPNTGTTFRVETNRYEPQLLYVASVELDAEEILDVLAVENAEIHEETGLVRLVADGSASFEADFEGYDAGPYDLTVATADTTAGNSTEITVVDGDGIAATFDEASYETARGDTLEFTVQLANVDEARLVVGDGDDLGYEVHLEVTDDDGDGKVTIRFDTGVAGGPNRDRHTLAVEMSAFEAVGDDGLVVTGADGALPLSEPLAPAVYELELHANDRVRDLAGVSIAERSLDDVDARVAPADAGLGDASEAEASSSPADVVAVGDALVIELAAVGGLDGATDPSDLEDEGISIALVERDPELNREANELDLRFDTEVRVDRANDTAYLVVDTDSVSGTVGGVEPGQRYEIEVELEESHPAVENGTRITRPVEFVDPAVALGDDHEIPAASDGTLTLDTTLAPGTDVEVVVRQRGADPFFLRETATVSEDGRISVDLDVADREVGSTVSVEVRSTLVGTVTGEATIVEQPAPVDDADEAEEDDGGSEENGSDDGGSGDEASSTGESESDAGSPDESVSVTVGPADETEAAGGALGLSSGDSLLRNVLASFLGVLSSTLLLRVQL